MSKYWKLLSICFSWLKTEMLKPLIDQLFHRFPIPNVGPAISQCPMVAANSGRQSNRTRAIKNDLDNVSLNRSSEYQFSREEFPAEVEKVARSRLPPIHIAPKYAGVIAGRISPWRQVEVVPVARDHARVEQFHLGADA